MKYKFPLDAWKVVKNMPNIEYPELLAAAFIAAQKDGISSSAVKREFMDLYESILEQELGYDV